VILIICAAVVVKCPVAKVTGFHGNLVVLGAVI